MAQNDTAREFNYTLTNEIDRDGEPSSTSRDEIQSQDPLTAGAITTAVANAGAATIGLGKPGSIKLWSHQNSAFLTLEMPSYNAQDTTYPRQTTVTASATLEQTQVDIVEETDAPLFMDVIEVSSDQIYANEVEVTASEHYERGTDIQGINWSRLPIEREAYRNIRRQMYESFQNESPDFDSIRQQAEKIHPNTNMLRFKYTRVMEKCSLAHFQLRNLLWATSQSDVYYFQGTTLRHWNSLLHKCDSIINIQSYPNPAASPFRAGAMSAHSDHVVVGGFEAELAYIRLSAEEETLPMILISDQAADIINYLEIFFPSSGSPAALISSNDSKCSVVNLDQMVVSERYPADWPVNCAQFNPDQSLLCMVGDSKEGVLMDPQSKRLVATLRGHQDYSFACAWSPNGNIIATGNQDKSTRLYDIRNTSTTLKVLVSELASPRSLRYSSDGKMLAVTEEADFVHVYDCHADYQQEQTINLFGEISGISFTPDGSSLFIGVADDVFGSLIEYETMRIFEQSRSIHRRVI